MAFVVLIPSLSAFGMLFVRYSDFSNGRYARDVGPPIPVHDRCGCFGRICGLEAVSGDVVDYY